MPSTYTPNLNLEKPAHGEHVNDWDEVVNTNLDAIDAAAWRIPVRASDPASPGDGEQWVRSDLAEWRISIGATTYKVSLTAV
jgi:hypothetical protein